MTTTTLVLASASPRRKELLTQIGVNFCVQAQDIDESVRSNELAADYVERIALEKAQSAISSQSASTIVLAADTTVVVDKQILAKPEDKEDARRMLNLLSNREHSVFSGVAVGNAQKLLCKVVQTKVTFSPISLSQIDDYWESGEPAGKAGAYAIQGFAAIFVESVTGSYSNIVGLPLFETAELLEEFGIGVWNKQG